MTLRSRSSARLRAGLLAAALVVPLLPGAAVASSHSAVDDGYDAVEDTPLSVDAPGVLGNDLPDPANVTAELVAGPANAASFTLNADGSFTYEPGANFNGADSFTYLARDLGDAASNVATVTITVAPVNDPPIANDDFNGGCGADPTAFGGAFPIPEDPRGDSLPQWPIGYEDWFFLFADCLFENDVDVDGDALSLEFVAQPAHGDVVNLEDVLVGYRPDPDYSTLPGDEPGGEWISDVLTYRLFDGTDYSNAAEVPIWVVPINDPPAFLPGPDLVSVAEDSGPYGAPWATDVSAGAENESHQTVTFEIVGIEFQGAGDFFSVAPALDGSGVLTFTPRPNGYGAAIVTVRAVDDGGLEDYSLGCNCYIPPDDTSDEVNFTIVVSPAHDAPVADDKVATTNEDEAVQIVLTASSVETDGLGISADEPAHGSLALGATICGSGTCQRTVTYTPDADYNGADSFTYTASDGSATSAPATVSITVEPVNDAPTFSLAGNLTVLEDAGPQTVADFATGFDPGPDDESGQTLVGFTVAANSNPGLFAADPDVDGDGTLTYAAAADANGVATITLEAEDSAGGVGQQEFTITVTAVNDAPSFSGGPNDTVAEDSGARAITGWATAISAGPVDESGQSVGFVIVSNTNAALFAAGPAVAPNGTLTYTPAANRFGSTTVEVRLTDNGGAINGGVDSSPAASFTITVTPVNDAPNAVNDVSFVVTAGSGPTPLDVLGNDTSLPDTGETLTIVAASTAAHGSVAITGGGTGLTYHPNAFFEGTDIFTYTISDGALTDTATVLVTVVPVGGVSRQWGADRYATAASISASTFAPGVPVAYIASGANFPDALAGAAAAGFRGGPVLLVNPRIGALPGPTAAELTRLAPDSIVVLGGPGAVPDAIFNLLDPYTTGPLTRQWGADRYATAASISASTFVAGVPVVYIASGANFPDALAGAAAAGFRDGPVLLVNPRIGALPGPTAAELTRLAPGSIVVLGGPGAVPDVFLSLLDPYTAGSITRQWGADRYATAASISAATFTPGVPVAYIASGTNFPDALAGAAAAGFRGGPVLLVNPGIGALPGPTAAELARLAPKSIVVLGGPGAVPDAIYNLLGGYVAL